MMFRRAAALLLPLAFAMPAMARPYANPRFHFALDLPESFVVAEQAADNGDGAAFQTEDGAGRIAVFGQQLEAKNFISQARVLMSYEQQEGWTMAYVSSPKATGVSFSGTKGDRIAYARAIPTCGGQAVAEYRIEYPKADKAKYDPVILRLNRSLRGSKAGCN